VIPDVDEAVDSPRRLTNDASLAQHVLDLVPDVPTPVWGRDDLQAGEMWNSNSLTSWLITRTCLGTRTCIRHPAGALRVGMRVLWSRGARPE
jgi:hypothetical protein